MKHIKVKKKLNKQKDNNKVVSYCLIALSIVFVFFMFFSLFTKDSSKFKLELRDDFVKEFKKNDTEEYETIGWLRVQGTNIDYPIIRAYDFSYSYPVEDESYVWAISEDSKYHNFISLSGHNILNLGLQPIMKDKDFMFLEELMNFVYPEFVKENQFIQLNIDGEDYLYQVFAVNFLKIYDLNLFPKTDFTKEEKSDYLKLVNKGNLYDFDLDVSEDDDFISIATCTRFYGKTNVNFVVSGKLIKDDKNADIVSFKTTKKYDEINNKMGGDENE